MPIYEFWCLGCREKSSFFVRTVASPVAAVCPHCGGDRMERAISIFAYRRATQTSEYGEVGSWAEERWQQTMGDEPLPGDIQEMIGAAREGAMPKPASGLPSFPDPLEGL